MYFMIVQGFSGNFALISIIDVYAYLVNYDSRNIEIDKNEEDGTRGPDSGWNAL